MRPLPVQPTDTLGKLVVENYYVYDDQGELDRERVISVAQAIIRRNPQLHRYSANGKDPIWDLTLVQASTTDVLSRSLDEYIWHHPLDDVREIFLPELPSIPRWKTNTADRKRLHTLWYSLLWVIGIGVGLCRYLIVQYWSQGPSGPQPLVWDWLELRAQQFVISPIDTINSALPWLTLWSLALFAIWLHRRPITTYPYLRTRAQYLLFWIIGLIVLIPGLYTFINAVVPLAATTLSQFTNLFPLLVIWSSLVFLVYLYHGDGSTLHQRNVVPYRGIWTVLAVVMLITVLTGYSGYQEIRARVAGHLSVLSLTRSTVQRLQESTHSTLDKANELVVDFNPKNAATMTNTLSDLRRDAADANLRAQAAHAQIATAIIYLQAQEQAEIARATAPGQASSPVSLITDSLQLQSAGASGTAVNIPDLIIMTNTFTPTSEFKYLQAQELALRQIDAVIHNAMTATQTITARLRNLPGNEQQALFINEQIIGPAQDADAAASIAVKSIVGIDFGGLPIFLWTGVLYAVLVLFPWMLLLLFLYRKRTKRAAQILDDLWRLDPSYGLLKRVLGGVAARNSPEEQKLQQVLREVSAKARRYPDQHLDDTRINDLIEPLAAHAFSNFEFLLSLFVLSLLTAIGWYYVFYPQTSLGLADLIERGAGIKEVSGYIVDNLTPLTMGFAGAYFFLMQMLVRRYLADDLYPSAFLQAAQRLLLIFMLTLALSLITPFMPPSVAGASTLAVILIAFLVGIYPNAGLRLLIIYANRFTRSKIFPETIVPDPLSKLTGVTIWTEARLVEENVENIESMATASVEQLVLGTHFPTCQIVDWIDQAILYLHAGNDGEWFPQFRTVGIRGASDLLDAAGLDLLHPDELHNRDFSPDKEALERIATAITSARASGLPSLHPDNPWEAVRNRAGELLESTDTVGVIAERAGRLAQTIDIDKPETYDALFALKQQALAAAQATQSAYVVAQAIVPLAEQLSAGVSAKQHDGDVFAQMRACLDAARDQADEVKRLSARIALDAQALDDLDELKLRLPDWHTKLSHVQTSTHAVIEIVQKLAVSADSKKQLAAFDDQLDAALHDARRAVDAANLLAQSLVVGDQTTLDTRQQLIADIRELQKLSDGLVEQHTALTRAIQHISRSDERKKQIGNALTYAGECLKQLKEPAQQAQASAQTLATNDVDAAAAQQSKKTILHCCTLFQEAQSAIQTAVFTIGSVALPPQMTGDILYEICDTIWPDPNISYILNFYQQIGHTLYQSPENPHHSPLAQVAVRSSLAQMPARSPQASFVFTMLQLWFRKHRNKKSR
jgi:hypothetical protein